MDDLDLFTGLAIAVIILMVVVLPICAAFMTDSWEVYLPAMREGLLCEAREGDTSNQIWPRKGISVGYELCEDWAYKIILTVKAHEDEREKIGNFLGTLGITEYKIGKRIEEY